jgi:hypothetical protein
VTPRSLLLAAGLALVAVHIAPLPVVPKAMGWAVACTVRAAAAAGREMPPVTAEASDHWGANDAPAAEPGSASEAPVPVAEWVGEAVVASPTAQEGEQETTMLAPSRRSLLFRQPSQPRPAWMRGPQTARPHSRKPLRARARSGVRARSGRRSAQEVTATAFAVRAARPEAAAMPASPEGSQQVRVAWLAACP